ncbi:hypothetical protein [Pseudoalteromonas denitrificans]|uniref:Lipoprotein n=1 Tax=Pseudoalteromonas denitrificans DSM 6059 TaxID=1123010 RepID=A0A1I1UFI4_9GAMM|nr:hypothetical protein [Pseudoalteromonas denitrificans]SFD69606.1 hypothetical protein SAMN02745724_05222 [Pseudoalteromonas denitrificans DSM 6059]
MKLNKLYLIFVFILCGCGGSSEGDKAQETVPTSITEPPNSTLLSENIASDNAQFSQFLDHKISINPQEYGFSSGSVYLKVYTQSQQVLFLGKVSSINSFQINLPNSIGKIYFDLFSPISTQSQFTGEIIL